MEEKLYFKPETSKKKQTGQRVEKAKEKKSRRAIKLVCLLLFLLVLIIVIILLLRGKTTTSGHFPGNIKNSSLTCISKTVVPEKLSAADSSDKELKINAIFQGSGVLKTLSLIYTLNYSSSDEAYGFEAKSHAEFNKALGASGYSVSKFKNKFARYDNKLIISLSANNTEIDQLSAPYFLLDVDSDGNPPHTLEEYQKNFEKKGFSCESSEDNSK